MTNKELLTTLKPGYYWLKAKPTWGWDVVRMDECGMLYFHGVLHSDDPATVSYNYPEARWEGPITDPDHCPRCGSKNPDFGSCPCDDDE